MFIYRSTMRKTNLTFYEKFFVDNNKLMCGLDEMCLGASLHVSKILQTNVNH